MKISQLLNIINDAAEKNGISKPFICGGLPRDRILNVSLNNFDIDITTGDETIHRLSQLCNEKLKNISSKFKVASDGHSSFFVGETKLDFSSNFISPDIDRVLNKAGIDNASSLKKEMYSRDFTCNALLMTMDLKKVLDPIGLGIKDMNSKVVRTCMPASITLQDSTKRVVRAIYIASKLNFRISDSIIKFVLKNPHLLMDPGNKYVSKVLLKSFKYNPEVTANSITQLDLWSHVPTGGELRGYIKKYME